MIIAENRSLLHHGDEILERAINQYWSVGNSFSKWHFLQVTWNIRSYTGNCIKVVGRLLDQKSKLPFI